METQFSRQENIETTHFKIGNNGNLQFQKEKHWNHPFLNREPLEPSVPKQENIETTHF